jgi:hypothetical protein
MIDTPSGKPGVWLRDAEVLVPGDPGVTDDRTTWKSRAVLAVHPTSVPFQIGWVTDAYPAPQYLTAPAVTLNGLLQMTVGDKNVRFLAHSLDGRPVVMELIDVTTANDPNYREVPSY